MHGGQFTVWIQKNHQALSHSFCRFFFCLFVLQCYKHCNICSAVSVKQSASWDTSTSCMGSNCPLLVQPACWMFHWLVYMCVWACVFFVLESWLALNYWSDVSVALFRVVYCVFLPQSTYAAFQIFLKRSVWVNFPPVWGWLLSLVMV